MDVTPIIPFGKKIINSYDEHSFTINEERYLGNIIIFPDKVIQWEIENPSILKPEYFDFLKDAEIEILLLGWGDTHKILDNNIRSYIKKLGVTIDVMTIGAACRTYNILLAEDRRIAVGLVRS